MHRRFTSVFLFMTLVALSCPLFSQTRTEYSDKDRRKMAEIAQRPEIMAVINKRWETERRKDLQFVFNVNNSSRIASLTPSALAEFRQNYGELYDNPILVRYVNTIGQRVVPKDSPNLYSFRLLLDPLPRAEALSTGTVYISTGLISLLDNEAQLAYVMGHEISHVERKHAYNRIRNEVLEEEFDKEKEVDASRKRGLFSALAAGAGAGIGGGLGGGSGALMGLAAGAAAGGIITHFAIRNKFEPTEWSKEFENEADEAGMKLMLDQQYDAREIPRLYARMDNMVTRDARVGLGFMGSPERVKERTAHVNMLLANTYKTDIEARLKSAKLVGSSPEFALLMAALKRDNGVAALDYDLFGMARENLEDAARLRSNDPRVHYYLGQVIALTGRTAEDQQSAETSFAKAIQYDQDRGAYPEPHLEEAMTMIATADPAKTENAKSELKKYVMLYQREHAGSLPPNIHIIYDYFQLAGDSSWYVPPVAVVSTKNVDALQVQGPDGNTAITTPALKHVKADQKPN